MRTGFRQSMAWLHSWAGLVVGWVLFAVFVTGTATYYKSDISHWMRPELSSEARVAPGLAADRAAAFLQAKAPDAMAWYVGLPKEEDPEISVMWWKSLAGPFHKARLDPATGEPSRVRATKGGDFLYDFHFELSLPPIVGRWIVGFCTMVLLVALVSGIVTHRRIFADFFTFRRDRSAQRGWLDAHNVVGVLALPFHLMIAYTGVVTLAPMYMPWGVTAAYGVDEMRFYVEAGLMSDMRAPAGRPGTLAPLAPMVQAAQARFAEPLEDVAVYNPGDAAATVIAFFAEPKGLAHRHPQVAFDGNTGAVIGGTGEPGALALASTAFVGLHQAHFAGPALRGLLFLCGLMGSAAIASGLVLWTVARLPKGAARAGFGVRLVQALNVGTVTGLPAAIAAYFLANRLLPVGLPGRADWEVAAFFAMWALVAAALAFRPHLKAWRDGFGLCALLYLALPVVAALSAAGHPAAGEARFLAFDAALAAIGLCLAAAAYKLAHLDPRRLTRAAEPKGALPQT